MISTIEHGLRQDETSAIKPVSGVFGFSAIFPREKVDFIGGKPRRTLGIDFAAL
jgi:hypothetical protein